MNETKIKWKILFEKHLNPIKIESDPKLLAGIQVFRAIEFFFLAGKKRQNTLMLF